MANKLLINTGNSTKGDGLAFTGNGDLYCTGSSSGGMSAIYQINPNSGTFDSEAGVTSVELTQIETIDNSAGCTFDNNDYMIIPQSGLIAWFDVTDTNINTTFAPYYCLATSTTTMESITTTGDSTSLTTDSSDSDTDMARQFSLSGFVFGIAVLSLSCVG